MMRIMARAAMRRSGARPADTLEDVFEHWSRAAPALADYRLTEFKDETGYANIHTNCALRGSGDVGACHRMMEYDREVMRTIGGEMVVVESQSNSGQSFCRVAFRTAGASMTDFTPAHEVA